MSERTSYFLFGTIIGACALALLIHLFPMTSPARKEAVKVGHAEYYLDDKHERQWRWKETQ